MNINLKNILSLFTADIAVRLIGFAATAYLARVLGKSGFGEISIALSVLTYITILSNSGLVLLGTRKVIMEKENISSITGGIFFTRFVVSFIVFILLLIICYLITESRLFEIIFYYALFIFPYSLLLEWFFTGFQRMGTISAGRLAGMAGYLLFILFFVKGPEDASMSGAGWTLGGILNTVLLWLFYKKSGYKIKIERGVKRIIDWLKEAFPLGTAGMISQFYIAFPVIYLGAAAGEAEAGVFNAALKIITLFLIFDRIFNFIFYPKITGLVSGSPSSLEEVFNKVLKIISIASFFIAISVSVSAEFIVAVVFGKVYSEAAAVLRVLSGYLIFTLLNSVFTYTMIAMKKEKAYTISLLLATGAFLFFILILTPFYGKWAVIYSFISFDLVSLLYMNFKLGRIINIKIFSSVVIPTIVTSGAGLLLFYFIKLPFYLELLLLVIVYLPLTAILAGFNKKEFNFLKRVLT